MNKMGTVATLALLLLLATATSVIAAKPVDAQSKPNLSAPEFTAKFVDTSYDVLPKSTTATDSYTGEEKVTTITGYHIQNATFVVTIKNQPFASYAASDHQVSLYYGVQVKGHFSTYWGNTTFYQNDQPFLGVSDGKYTTVVFGLGGNNGTYDPESGRQGFMGASFIGGSYGGQADFRVIAVAGYYISVQDPPNPFNVRHPYHLEFITVQTSDWSNAQTLTISENSISSPTSNPTASPTTTSPTVTPTIMVSESPTLTPNKPEGSLAVFGFVFNWLEVAVFVVVGVVVALLVVVIVLMSRRIKILEHKVGA